MTGDNAGFSVTQTIYFAGFQSSPNVAVAIKDFIRYQSSVSHDSYNDESWGIKLSVNSVTTTSAVIQVVGENSHIDLVGVQWIACPQ